MHPGLHAYRRCHVCGTVCKNVGQVKRCTQCHKPFAPFYYFDDQCAPVFSEGQRRPPDLAGQWRPIHGLTAYWQPD